MVETKDRLDRAYVVVLASLIGLYVALFAYYVGAAAIRVPVYDMIAWVMHYARYWQAGAWWSYFWLPHNEHRLVWSRLLVLLDIEWFRGSTLPFLLFNVACFGSTLGGIAWEIRACGLPRWLKTTLIAQVVLLLAASYIGVDCSVPILGVYLHMTGFLVLSLVLLDAAGERGRVTTARRVAAIVAAILAAFGTAGGLAAALVLLWAAWRGGLNWRWLVAIGLVAVGLIAAYLPGIPLRQESNAIGSSNLAQIVDYLIRFLGLPWSHAPSLVWFGRIVGVAVLGLAVSTILRQGVLTSPATRLERLGVGLLLFALAIAGIVTLGRINIAPEREMPIRYGIFPALAEVGLLLAYSSQMARFAARGGKRLLQWGTVGIAAVLLVQQVAAGQAAVAVSAQYNDSYRRFAAGQWTPEMEHYVYPDRAEAERARALMQAQGIYQN
jgi:hypothetical protein